MIREFKIKTSLTMVMFVDLVLLSVLLVLGIVFKEAWLQIGITIGFVVALALICFEMHNRVIVVSPDSLTIKKFCKNN
ncbi:MAG: hypothetical protein WCJ49_01290 [Deltaproteobacteria bacterium]